MNTNDEIGPVPGEPAPAYLKHHPAVRQAFQGSQGPNALFQGGESPDSPPEAMQRPTLENTPGHKIFQNRDALVVTNSDSQLQEVLSSEFEEVPAPEITGGLPQSIRCYRCKTEQVTYTRRRLGALNYFYCWAIAIALGILSVVLFAPVLLLPVSLIPLCMGGLMDVEHYCPKCDTLNGVFRRRDQK